MSTLKTIVLCLATALLGIVLFVGMIVGYIIVFGVIKPLGDILDKGQCRQILRLLAIWSGDRSWKEEHLVHNCLWGTVRFLKDSCLQTIPILEFEKELHAQHAYYPPFWLVELKCPTLYLHSNELICSRGERGKYELHCFDRFDRGYSSEARIITPEGDAIIINLAYCDESKDLFTRILEFVEKDQLRLAIGLPHPNKS